MFFFFRRVTRQYTLTGQFFLRMKSAFIYSDYKGEMNFRCFFSDNNLFILFSFRLLQNMCEKIYKGFSQNQKEQTDVCYQGILQRIIFPPLFIQTNFFCQMFCMQIVNFRVKFQLFSSFQIYQFGQSYMRRQS